MLRYTIALTILTSLQAVAQSYECKGGVGSASTLIGRDTKTLISIKPYSSERKQIRVEIKGKSGYGCKFEFISTDFKRTFRSDIYARKASGHYGYDARLEVYSSSEKIYFEFLTYPTSPDCDWHHYENKARFDNCSLLKEKNNDVIL
ncbi:MAG: hypothetical protein AB7I27_15990 [Bacteriovoracaceae bacterium]